MTDRQRCTSGQARCVSWCLGWGTRRAANGKTDYGVTGSPMSLYDFYMYLKYIEFSSENLEFYIW